MVLALIGGFGELALAFGEFLLLLALPVGVAGIVFNSGGSLLVLALPVGILGVSLELYQFHRLDSSG
jgi:hypothetical protein